MLCVCESESENKCVCVCVRERERERERETFLDENKIFLEISFSYQKFSDQKCGVFLCYM